MCYENKDKKIKDAIKEVLVFFDMFNYPLTCFEIWQFLKVKCRLSDVVSVLESVDNFGLENKDGFYFLQGRSEIIKIRNRRYNFTDKKIKRAIWVARVFKFVPWIKMIAVGNMMGANNLRKGSDIDFFVITEKNRIWLTRFFCVLIIKILRLRPAKNNTCDKICLSFFVDETAIDLRKLMLTDCRDIYFIYWLAGIVPIYDRGGVYENLIKSNVWIKEHLPNWKQKSISHKRNSGKPFSPFYRDVLDLFLGGIENRFKKLQLKVMSDKLKSAMNKDGGVVVNDNVLKLHVNDRRREFYLSVKHEARNMKQVLM